jgi:subtilisin family serine protease
MQHSFSGFLCAFARLVSRCLTPIWLCLLTSVAWAQDFVPGEVLVKVKRSAELEALEQLYQQGELGSVDELAQLGAGSLRKIRSRSKSTQELLTFFQSDSNTDYVEPNYIVFADTVPNDPMFGQLWGLRNPNGADIKAEPAWSVTTGSRAIVVGVVDTGINYNHPDLIPNVWNNPGGIGGCAAGTHGYNALTKTCDPLDDNSHGSHTAGTIGAAGNNGLGVVGVNWTTQLMGLKFLDAGGSGSTANAIEAIEFAVQAKIAGVNVRVLNNSWGGSTFSQALIDEMNRAGSFDILFVAAAGNSSENTDIAPHYPGSYLTANEITVAATEESDGLAGYSSYGPNSVHLGAPGSNIWSTDHLGGYVAKNGTSMATPHVSGAAALILSAPATSLTVGQLKARILANVDPIASLAGKTTTGGRLNVCKAIPGCGGPPPIGFSLSASPSSQSVIPGMSTSYTITITPTGGFADPVTLTSPVAGLPSGAVGTFTPNPTVSTSTLTVTTSSTGPTGTFPLTIAGSSGSIVGSSGSAVLLVSLPDQPDFSLNMSPPSQTVLPGMTTTYLVGIVRTGGFSGDVALTAALPPGANGTFSPNPASGDSSMLTVVTEATTPTGSFPITITGTSGSLPSRATSATLVVGGADCSTAQGDCQQ